MSDAVVIALYITPRAARDAIEDVDDEGVIRARVTAAPADGAANKAVLRLLAKSLGLPKSAVTLTSGASSRHKRVRLAGVQAAALQRRWPGASVREV